LQTVDNSLGFRKELKTVSKEKWTDIWFTALQLTGLKKKK